jgi:hypothetical protein
VSAAGPSEDTRPLTDQEYRQVQRLFSDPFSFPIAFKAWLTAFVETSDLRLPQATVHSLPDAIVVASDAIPKQIFDAKGDLLAGTADDHYERFPLGPDGDVLTADATLSSGLKWATPRVVATDPLWDAKGDLAVATGPDSAVKLVVGADGQVLTADSTQTRGIKWAALSPALTLNTQTSSYTLVLSDAGKLVGINNASANTLTVPTNASVAFPVGTPIRLRQPGAGQTTVAGAAGVTLNALAGAFKLAGQYANATLVKVASDTWELSGDIVP